MYRKHLRLKEFDYSSSNWYFVTVCTNYRKKLFSSKLPDKYNNESVVRTMSSPTTKATDTVERVLLDLPNYYNNLVIDFYVFMSDHLHIVVGFEGKVTLKNKPTSSRHYALGDIVGMFKQVSTKRLHKQLGLTGFLFQPNYYEHVIRNEQSLQKICRYILNNPLIEHQQIPWKLIDPIV